MSYEITIDERDSQPVAVVCGTVTIEELPAFLGKAFSEVLTEAGEQGLHVTGPPLGLYHLVGDGFDVTAGFPTSAPVEPHGSVVPMLLPAGPVATTMHVGSYEEVADAYAAVTDWLAASDYVPTAPPWESYLDDPSERHPRTLVCFPCRTIDSLR